MRTILRGGTDAGSMAIFDRAALPRDYKLPDFTNPDYAGFQQAGQLCILETCADGEYNVALLLDEELRSLEREFSVSRNNSQLQVPSGTLNFCGLEFVFWPQGLEKHSHMGETGQVAAGVYQAEVYEIEYPEGWEEEKLEERLGSADYQSYERGANRGCALGCLFCVGVIASLMAMIQFWISGMIAVTLLLAVTGALWRRHERAFKFLREKVEAQNRAIGAEFPFWIVRLNKIG